MAKNRGADRDTSRDYAELIPIPKEDKEHVKGFGYDKCLKIVLYGDPYSDSRPKANMKTGGLSMVNQQLMKKSFGQFFKRCDLLKELTITSVYHMKCKFYMEVTQVDRKLIKKMSKTTQRLFEKEYLGFVGEKDVDNMIKIHNDMLLQPEFRITLTDGFQIGQLKTEAFLSPDNPRAEVYVYFNSKEKNDYYYHKLRNYHEWYYWQISYKNWVHQSNRDNGQQLKHMRKIIHEMLEPIKQVTTMRRKVSNILKEFVYYPADVIKELAGIDPSNKMNRMDAEYKLGLLLFEKIPLAYELIQQGGKRIEQTEASFE